MTRLILLSILIIPAICLSSLFSIKYKVQDLVKEIAEMQRQMLDEKEAIHVLNAEWAYLTKPERIRKLSSKHLNLEVVKVSQVRKIDQKDKLPVLAMRDSNDLDELENELSTIYEEDKYYSNNRKIENYNKKLRIHNINATN